jgi:leucyl aminopeptidase (aminopeptidase T)
MLDTLGLISLCISIFSGVVVICAPRLHRFFRARQRAQKEKSKLKSISDDISATPPEVVRKPVSLKVERGRITSISGGEEAKLLEKSLRNMDDPRVFLVGEIGFGLNTGASISGRMLEDEGVYGTMHIGIGNNLSYGGTNDTPIHIDLIMKNPTYAVDGRVICKDGEYATTP